MSRKVGSLIIAAAALLMGMLALPYVTVADATSDIANRNGGYRTCFLKDTMVFDETPRLEKVRHCVFDR